MSDVQQGFQHLYQALEAESLSPATLTKFSNLASALSKRDYMQASQVHVQLITDAWAETKGWLSGVKKLINVCKKVR